MSNLERVVDKNATFWYTDGELGREDDEPTIVYHNGDKVWMRRGVVTRKDKPAIVYADGSYVYWFVYGKLSRNDGPAVTWKKCNTESAPGEAWYLDGKRHRVGGGPALTQTGENGYEAWYENGRLHREGGPAVVRTKTASGELHLRNGDQFVTIFEHEASYQQGKRVDKTYKEHGIDFSIVDVTM